MISSSPSSPQLICDSWQYLDSGNKYRWLTESLCRPGQLTISCLFLENTYWRKKTPKKTAQSRSSVWPVSVQRLQRCWESRVQNSSTVNVTPCGLRWQKQELREQSDYIEGPCLHIFLKGKCLFGSCSSIPTLKLSDLKCFYRKSKGREVSTQHL